MRILLANDRADVRSALRFLLDQELGIDVIGETSDIPDLLRQAAVAQPDIVLLDRELLGSPASELIESLRHCFHEIKIVVLSGRPEARTEVLAAGVDAFVSKGEPPEHLLAIVHGFETVG